MSLGERIVRAIEARRDRLRKAANGPSGEFYRDGGDDLLYDLPVETGGVVIDAGGYLGEWTEKMVAHYGCRSEIYEPVPAFADQLRQKFRKNSLVRVHAVALGSANRTARLLRSADGTTEFGMSEGECLDVPVRDISEILDRFQTQSISCLKLNIEGGEYDVLERLLDTGKISKIACLLVQFHSQPAGWATRLKKITQHLDRTHMLEWGYALVWEKWILKR